MSRGNPADDLNASLGYLYPDLAADSGLLDQFRAATTQAFEFTW